MKKQLLIAAVAATMGTAAMADLSITGNAKFEFTNTETGSNAAVNATNTEVNIKIKGSHGDTTVVLNNEFNSSSAAGAGMDTEDMYISTKIGDVAVKAGNFASGTSALGGEIDNGSRAQDKVSLSTSVGGFKIGYAVAESGSALNSDSSSVSVSGTVGGFKVSLKDDSDSYTLVGVSGDVAGFGVRLEQKNSDTANNDVTFGNITKEVNGVTLGYAWVDADAVNLITENDSSIFAREGNGATVDGVNQISAKLSAAGNAITLKTGTVEEGSTDNDFTQIDVKRSLASGATLAATYTDYDVVNSADTTEKFEIDLSVKF